MKRNILLGLNKSSLALVCQVGQLAQGQGMKAHLVGGPVRDLLLKHPNVDLDITVEGNGMRLAAIFAAQYPGAVVTCYPAFKTATVLLPGNRMVDFATARKETYARPGVFPAVVPSNIREDLLRRDFTINALAIALNPTIWGRMQDPSGGLADLRAKKIRVLHDQSFIDDPTRILRTARFKARLDFTIERTTMKWLKAAVRAKALDAIKPQRYLKEFNKILKEKSSKSALKYLKLWNALM